MVSPSHTNLFHVLETLVCLGSELGPTRRVVLSRRSTNDDDKVTTTVLNRLRFLKEGEIKG